MTNKEKYKKAFDVLASSEQISLEVENMANKKQKKSFMAITAAAVLVFGTLTVSAAAYYNWSNGLSEELRIDEEKQKMMEDTGMAAFPEVSCTDAGVTVTAQQSITDNYYTYLSFKFEGYELEEGKEPSIENVSVTVDGSNEFSWGGSFYDGLICGPDGQAVYADGSPIDYDQPILGHYERDDGSLEFHMVLENSGEKGSFVGKPIHVEFKNLGTAGKEEHFPVLDGTWVLDWTLGGTDTAKVYEMNESLGDTGATVKEIEISPVSCHITYEFPRTEITKEFTLADGTTETSTEHEEAPWPQGVKLKDGTLLTMLYGGPGTSGFVDDTTNTYVASYSFYLDIFLFVLERVLFTKDTINVGEIATEDNYYCVPLK